MPPVTEQFLQQRSKSYTLLVHALRGYLKDNEAAVQEILKLVCSVSDELQDAVLSTAASTRNGSAPGSAPQDSPCYEFTDLMFNLPRGKQTLKFFPTNLQINSKANTVTVPYTAIESVAILDSLANDPKKEKVLLYLVINKAAGVTIGKNVTEAVIIQTSGAEISAPALRDDTYGDLKGPSAVVLCELLGKFGSPVFHNPDADTFNSSTDCSSLVATVKATSGLLFPLPKAMVFVDKPATFLPLETIKFIDLQRANGLSSTFDVAVHMKDKQILEFSQIDQKEVNGMRDYMAACNLYEQTDEDAEVATVQKKSGKEKAVGPPPPHAAGGGDELDEDEDEDDEDFDPDVDEGPGRGKGGGSRGPGGARSTKHTADDEDDEEEEEEEEEEDDDEEEEEDDDDDDDDEDVELEDEEGIAASDIHDLMEEDRSLKRQRVGGSSSGAS